ncbi:MAG: hypothetical protein IT368_07420 [Candidatus Hydrogenedentes bacterium]|nr:hypothetical protein [Candidatus Hydrogenedentota bacterium]
MDTSQPTLRTRFAPSPTGYLHLGHVAHALCVWQMAERLGAQVLLRIEDHDRGRCRREYEAAILNDLEWLGFKPDIAGTAEFRRGACPWRQSDRGPFYERMLQELTASQHVYACTCSRKEVLARTGQESRDELWYDGYCRNRGLPLERGCGIRVALPDGSVRFEDLLAGAQVQVPARQCGDLLLRDRHGNWTYQFAVVADDLDHDINLVIRGLDLIESTGRQLLLARMLGRPTPPVFAHHPLLYDETGKKLSKRFYATSVAQLREAGHSASAVLAEAQALLGAPWEAITSRQM